MNIAILYGGRSSEHEVSLRSAASVLSHLDKDKYSVTLIGVSKEGQFYLQKEAKFNGDYLHLSEKPENEIFLAPFKGFYHKQSKLDIDCVFPVVHGTFCEDGSLQGLLEHLGLPYVSTSVTGSALGMDKVLAKQIFQQNDIPVVPFDVLTVKDLSRKAKTFLSLCEAFGLPFFLKPARGGSSVGVYKIETEQQFFQDLEKAFLYDNKVLAEKSINGREIECSVVGLDDPIAYPLGEIISSHQYYDYEAKYLDPDGARLLIPADVPKSVKSLVQDYAVKAYKVLTIDSYARVDFFLEHGSQQVYLNEINTIPGFTSISMFPMLCAEGGLSYPDLLERLIDLAVTRHKQQSVLHYSK